MPKYDAFGREIGEDTLAGLGGDEQASPAADWESRIADARAAAAAPEAQPQPTPPPAPEPASFTAAPQVPIAPPPSTSRPTPGPTFAMPRTGRRNRGGLGCLVGLLILGAVLVGPVIAIVSFVSDTADTVRSGIDKATRDTSDATPPPPQGLGARSMIRAENLEPALRKLQALGLGKLGDLTIRADRVDATLVTRRTRQRSIVITYTDEVRRGDVRDVGIPQDTLAWGDIDPRVPQRLARAGAGKAGADDINYVIARPPTVFDGGKLTWIAYYTSGRIVQGDAEGKPTRRIS